MTEGTPRNFMLVHGAWHGGWCWRRVCDRIERRGHRAFAPTLTGLCERSHLISPSVNLTTHIDDIVNIIRWENLGDVILVGHSYGGFVISGVVERVPETIASIVFLDAFMPENGQAVRDLTIRSAGIQELMQRGETAMKQVPAAFFRVNENDRAWVDAKCTPQPLATFTEPISLTGVRERIPKKSYIRATNFANPPLDAGEQKAKERGWKIYRVPCGHNIMIDTPDRLTDILLEVA